MAVPDSGEASDPSLDFLEHSYLTYIIPFETDFNLEQALNPGKESNRPVFDAIEQREWLFFDETVDVYLVLRTPYRSEKSLRSFLSRLVISLEAQIANSHASDRDSPPSSEAIYEGTVEETEDPFVVVDEPEDSDGEESQEQHVYAVWKLSVFMARPRIRLQGPSAVFSATASLKPAEKDHGVLRNGYLPSRVPSGLNLLEAFGNDPALGNVKPRLSALRVSRVAPVTQPKGQLRPLKALHSLSLKIFPAVHARVRFSRPNNVPPSPALIALLELDFTPFFDCEVILSSIVLAVTDGTAEDLNAIQGMGPPLNCVAHDHVTFLYRLAPAELNLESGSPATRDLDIVIEVSALVKPGACTPHLKMSWTTALDFTLPLNPGFGPAGLNQAIQRAHRPSQLSIGGGPDAQSLVSPSVSRPDALPSLEAATRSTETTIPDFGITMTFTGPDRPVYPGDEFRWAVFVVNRSPALQGASSAPGSGPLARKLALLAIAKRRRNELRVVRPPSTAGAAAARRLVADAVLDENVVHAMQRSSVVDSTDLVCLSADVRVGPLAPGACAVVELKFLALREGVVGVECIRVVDLGSQEHVDVRELPVVVVERRP